MYIRSEVCIYDARDSAQSVRTRTDRGGLVILLVARGSITGVGGPEAIFGGGGFGGMWWRRRRRTPLRELILLSRHDDCDVDVGGCLGGSCPLQSFQESLSAKLAKAKPTMASGQPEETSPMEVSLM